MKKSLALFLFLFLTFLIIAFPGKVSAYYESAGPGDLRSSIYPQNPGINQKANITLASYTVNLDTCNTEWKQDQKPITKGVGQKSFSFTTGKLGQTVAISATIDCPNKAQMKKNWLFQSHNVEFLFVADTYTPPFYKGGSLATSKSNVKIVAFPQVFTATGEMIKAENLIYRWSKNGKAMPNSSGYGKNSLNVQANELPGYTNYSVEILSATGETKVTKTFSLDTGNPKLIFYENKPLLGIQSQKGQGKLFELTESETALNVEPFFFNNSDLINGAISFNWTMNGKKITSNSNGLSIILRQNSNQSGEATIGLEAVNTSNLFSSANKNLKINFGQKNSLLGF